MLCGGQPVRLPFVARGVGQHKVMAQIDRVARPRDEVIHLPSFAVEWLTAVEAPAGLELPDDWPYDIQIGTVTAEQEFVKVRLFRQPAGVEPPDVLRPRAFDQIDDQRVVPAETETYAYLQGDAGPPAFLITTRRNARLQQKCDALRTCW